MYNDIYSILYTHQFKNSNVAKFYLDRYIKFIESRKNRILTEETKRKLSLVRIGTPSPRKGAKLSDETKLKLSLARGTKILCVETNETFNSIKSAIEKFNIKNQNAIKRALENDYLYRGFHWKYVN